MLSNCCDVRKARDIKTSGLFFLLLSETQFPEKTHVVSNMSKENSHPCDLQGLSVWASKTSREIPRAELGMI